MCVQHKFLNKLDKYISGLIEQILFDENYLTKADKVQVSQKPNYFTKIIININNIFQLVVSKRVVWIEFNIMGHFIFLTFAQFK